MEVRTRPAPLVCIECAEVEDDSGRGWRTYLADGAEFVEPELLVYCPACARREFDEG